MPQGRQLIHGYGNGRFRIAGETQSGSVLVWPERRAEWPIAGAGDISFESLAAIVEDLVADDPALGRDPGRGGLGTAR